MDRETTSTTFADAPAVRVETRGEGLPDLYLGYPSAAHAARTTQILFGAVFDYRWYYYDLHAELWNEEDVDFGLIEILDSDWIRHLLAAAKRFGYPLGDQPGAARREKDFRHFRITFDNHGTYDVVSLAAHVSTSPARGNIAPGGEA